MALVIQGVTLDTGALIALERSGKRMRDVLAAAIAQRLPITVPSPVLTEWWREPSKTNERILRSVDVEQLTAHLAKLAGQACKAVPQATAIDAIVMASAAQRGDVVYTSDFDDLERLRSYFPNVRVLRA
jgi:predicted nucleic acid-binding protein